MANRDIIKLLAGFKRFHQKYYAENGILSTKLAAGQTPKTLIIGCSDSRVDPAIISSAALGELFVVRNVANLVPPYETTLGQHGVSAAIEFAMVSLKVENIVVLGHRQCGGIHALLDNADTVPNSFVGKWIQIASPARDKVKAKFPNYTAAELWPHCEKESIVCSLNNLRTFPFVAAAIEAKQVHLTGLYFDLELGKLEEYLEATNDFRTVEI